MCLRYASLRCAPPTRRGDRLRGPGGGWVLHELGVGALADVAPQLLAVSGPRPRRADELPGLFLPCRDKLHPPPDLAEVGVETAAPTSKSSWTSSPSLFGRTCGRRGSFPVGVRDEQPSATATRVRNEACLVSSTEQRQNMSHGLRYQNRLSQRIADTQVHPRTTG